MRVLFSVRSGLGRRREGFPIVWEQGLNLVDRMGSDSREHIAEPGKWLDRVPLARRDEAQQHGRRLAAMVAAEERPVATPNRYAPVRSLGGAIVDLQIAVFQIAVQRLPLIQRVPNRPCHFASGVLIGGGHFEKAWCIMARTGTVRRATEGEKRRHECRRSRPEVPLHGMNGLDFETLPGATMSP